MLRFSRPAAEPVRKALNRAATDHFLIGQIADFAAEARAAVRSGSQYDRIIRTRWAGDLPGGIAQACDMAINGDLSRVAASDKLLTELEERFPAPTARRQVVDDVAGGFVNVPAMLAGVPTYMRRKAKAQNEFAPLVIVADLTSSAAIDAEDVTKRGVAILALVRALSARRPVELWAGVSLDADGYTHAVHVYFQIPAAPLDVARAGFLLTHPAACRGMAYGIAAERHGYKGGWPYGADADVTRRNFASVLAPAFPHADEILALPSVHYRDDSISNPVEWIAEHIRQYGEGALAEAA